MARSRHDPAALTANARRTFLERFERQVREESPELPEPEIQRRAAALRQAHMLGLSLKSSIARTKKAVTPAKVTAQESDDDVTIAGPPPRS